MAQAGSNNEEKKLEVENLIGLSLESTVFERHKIDLVQSSVAETVGSGFLLWDLLYRKVSFSTFG